MTEQAQAPAPQEDPINGTVLTFQLTVAMVNMILVTLSKLPYEQSAELIAIIRQQGDPQVGEARAKMAAGPTPAPAPPELSANTNRKSRRAAGAKKH